MSKNEIAATRDRISEANEALREWLSIWDAVCDEADPDEGPAPEWEVVRMAMMKFDIDPIGFPDADYFSDYMHADLVYRVRDLVHALNASARTLIDAINAPPKADKP